MTLANTSACDVFWTPTQATTLAANTSFAGTIIDAAGITTGAQTLWIGLALAFGGTVTTDATNISAPVCTITPSTPVVITPAVIVNNTSSISLPTVPVTASSGSMTITSTSVVTSGSIVPTSSTSSTNPVRNNIVVPTIVYEPVSTIKPTVTPIITSPRLPNTGIAPEGKDTLRNIAVLAGILMLALASMSIAFRRHNI